MKKYSEKLIKLAERANTPIYAVGGFVRNEILGLSNTDIDLACALLPQELEQIANGIFRCDMTYNRFGSVLLISKETNETYEYTTFRKDCYIGDSHSPSQVVFTKDIRTDAMRRDFTANAIYQDVLNGDIVDPLCGEKDVRQGVLRSCNKDTTFKEDGLRIMRLARISAELGFSIDKETFCQAKDNVKLLYGISAERKAAELNRILLADKKYPTSPRFAHYEGLKTLDALGALTLMFPEFIACKEYRQSVKRHKFDAFNHILETVKYSDSSVRLAALFHDIGKPACYKQKGNGYEHARFSAKIAKRYLGQDGLKYPNSVVNEVYELCLYHMLDKDGNLSDKKVLLFMARNYGLIPKLILLKRADFLGSGMRSDEVKEVKRWEELYHSFSSKGLPTSISELKINGFDVISVIGDENKTSVSKVLNSILDKTVLCEIKNDRKCQLDSIKTSFRSVGGGQID